LEIHPTAIVNPKAEIAEDVSIGPFSVIEENVQIGRGSKIGTHVVIENGSEIGEGCTFFPFSSIGGVPQDLKFKGEDSKVRIGNGNTFREYVTVNRATLEGSGETVIGNGNFFMAYVHIAHDCRIGNHVIMANAATLAGLISIEDFAIIGGLVGIHQFVRIGAYAMVGGCSAIGQDIPPFMTASGIRASLFGLNSLGLKRHGFSEERIAVLKKAYKILFRLKLTLKEAVKKVRDEVESTPDVEALLLFIENSKRGVCR
jgi:UDP-N-acetylglucosamine acyltransferase